MDWLSNDIGPLTVQQWGLAVIALMAVSAIVNWLKSRPNSSDQEKLSEGRCLVCSWSGKVSRYHRTCPKCGNSITRMSRNER